MALGDFLLRRARRPEQRLERRGVQGADRRLARGPLVIDPFARVTKKPQIQLEAASGVDAQDPAHLGHEARPAVGRQAHDLVFVAVMREAEVLGERLEEDAERMRKVDLLVDRDRAAAPQAPGRAGKVTETVHRHRSRFVEGRGEKGRGEVRAVMLYEMHLAVEGLRHGPLKERVDTLTLAFVADALEHQRRVRPAPQQVGQLAAEIGARILVDCDLRDVVQPDTRIAQAPADRLRRKPGPMLEPPEALLLRCRHQHAVAQQAGRCVRVIGVDAENDQAGALAANQFQAVRTISVRCSWRGVQPSTSRALRESATSAGGSPGRRPPTT